MAKKNQSSHCPLQHSSSEVQSWPLAVHCCAISGFDGLDMSGIDCCPLMSVDAGIDMSTSGPPIDRSCSGGWPESCPGGGVVPSVTQRLPMQVKPDGQYDR